jgi:hypothetical protein
MMGAVSALLGLGSLIILALTNVSAAQSPRRQGLSALPIQGAQALRLDLLRQASWPFASWRHPPGATRLDRPLPSADAAAIDPAEGRQGAAVRVVREFYQSLRSDPAFAKSLVAPNVLGSSGAEVERSWAEVAAVWPLRIRAQPDGSVIAEILAQYADGGRLLLWHRVTLRPGPVQTIMRIELLTSRSFRVS